MCVVGVALGNQVVPEESTARLCTFSLPLAMACVLPGKRNTVNPELRTIRHCSTETGFAWATATRSALSFTVMEKTVKQTDDWINNETCIDLFWCDFVLPFYFFIAWHFYQRFRAFIISCKVILGTIWGTVRFCQLTQTTLNPRLAFKFKTRIK